MCDCARGAWVAPHWVSDGVTVSRAAYWDLLCNFAFNGSSIVFSSYYTRLLLRLVCIDVYEATRE